MKIKLKDPIPELADKYRKEVQRFIDAGLITLEEWNSRFKDYRDEYGYSIIHYLDCVLAELDCFVTNNPIMLENRKELQKRFGIKIATPEEELGNGE